MENEEKNVELLEENEVKTEEKNTEEKKRSARIPTLMVIVLFCVFSGIGFAFGGLYTSREVIINNSGSISKSETSSNSEVVNIDVDALSENLISRVGLVSLGAISDDSFNYDGYKASDLSDTQKGKIAFTYYYYKALNLGNEISVSEEDVKYAYDSIFGAGTYKSGQEIFGVCNGKLSFKYDSAKNEYVAPQPACGGTSVTSIFEKITSVKRDGNRLIINTAMLIRDGDSIYKTKADLDSKKAISTIKDAIGEEYTNTVSYSSDEKINDYISNNSDSLTQYSYTFEQASNGFYKFVGFEKIK